MTRTVSKLFPVEHQPRLVYYATSASNENYFNIQAVIKFFLSNAELKLPNCS